MANLLENSKLLEYHFKTSIFGNDTKRKIRNSKPYSKHIPLLLQNQSEHKGF